jgi:flavin reductase (DIM6/NTAB) family NADH-FMN oxidoreductase RutF
MELTPEVLRRAFAAFPSGVTAVAGMIDDHPVGLTASTFTPVSLEPPLVSICVARTSTTWPTLRRAPSLGVSVLAAGHGEVARAMSAKQGDRFAGLDWNADESGAVLVNGSALWLTCTLENEFPAGDHEIALLRIHRLQVFPDVAPLVFHGSLYRQLAYDDVPI